MKRWFLLLLTTALAAWTPRRANVLTNISSKDNVRELIIVNQQLWFLSGNGTINIYNAQGSKLTIPSVERVTAKHIANDGHDVIAQIGSTLQRWTSADATWRVLGKLPEPAFALAVNSQRHIFAITSKGVWNMEKNSFLLPTSSPNNQILLVKQFSAPATYFMDAQDNLWIGYGYGEWGGNIFTYSTSRSEFINLTFNNFQINLNPIKSFFQLESSVGVASGLQHMSNAGAIASFQGRSATLIYNTWTDIHTTSRENRWTGANKVPYIGPATYEPESATIYLYSNQGIFKGRYKTDLSRFQNWQLVFSPKLHWRNGQRAAVGSPMNVLRMLPLGGGKLALLTQNDGVGIWDGTLFKLLN